MPPPPLFSFELDCTLPDFLELWDARYAEYLAAIGCRARQQKLVVFGESIIYEREAFIIDEESL